MKILKLKLIILYVICLHVYACKQTCVTPNNVLSGKIKSWVEYSNVTDTNSDYNRFRFYYDSINGNLVKVKIDKKNSGTFYNDVDLLFNRINNNNIQVYYKQDTSFTRVFNVYVQGKRIIKITEQDTISNVEVNSTLFYDYNDSLFDIGYNPSLNTNISLFKFVYNGDDYTSYISSANYTIYFPFTQSYFVSDTLSIAYNSSLNDNKVRFQIPGCRGVDNSSIIRILAPFLLLDGYYFMEPNKHLIDSITTSNGTEKFEYYFTGSLITKVTYIFRRSGLTINTDVSYYD